MYGGIPLWCRMVWRSVLAGWAWNGGLQYLHTRRRNITAHPVYLPWVSPVYIVFCNIPPGFGVDHFVSYDGSSIFFAALTLTLTLIMTLKLPKKRLFAN